jgi:ribosomal protein S18 acetylase RimI-like enzyme
MIPNAASIAQGNRVNVPIEIRPAQAGDIGRVVAIAGEVQEYVAKERKGQAAQTVEFSMQAAHYERFLTSPEHGFFVAVIAGVVIGYALVAKETEPDDLTIEPRADVYELAVAESHRGQGAGSALLTRVEQWAAERGLELVQLAVWEFNAQALKLYDRAGYRSIMRKMERRIRPRPA